MDAIYRRRLELGLTQQQMAVKVGLHPIDHKNRISAASIKT